MELFSHEWEVVTVRFVPCGDRAVSMHSDWLSNDFARCDWLNRCLQYRTVTSVTPSVSFPLMRKRLYLSLGVFLLNISYFVLNKKCLISYGRFRMAAILNTQEAQMNLIILVAMPFLQMIVPPLHGDF